MRLDPFLQSLDGDDTLPAALRVLHSQPGRYRGHCSVERGKGWLVSRLLRLGGFPSDGQDIPVCLTVTAEGETWIWQRDFGGHVMQSALTFDGQKGCVQERFGPLSIWLRPFLSDATLSIEILRLSVFGVGCPRFLLPQSATIEWQDEEGRFCFDVSAAVPGLGRLIRYTGWLTLPHEEPG